MDITVYSAVQIATSATEIMRSIRFVCVCVCVCVSECQQDNSKKCGHNAYSLSNRAGAGRGLQGHKLHLGFNAAVPGGGQKHLVITGHIVCMM